MNNIDKELITALEDQGIEYLHSEDDPITGVTFTIATPIQLIELKHNGFSYVLNFRNGGERVTCVYLGTVMLILLAGMELGL